MTNAQKIIAATAAGAVAGLVAGILIAPDKGSETRKRIADASKKVADNVKEFAEAGVSTASTIKDKLFSKRDEFADSMSENSHR